MVELGGFLPFSLSIKLNSERMGKKKKNKDIIAPVVDAAFNFFFFKKT